MLIRQISAQVGDLTGEALAVLPINDLNILAASNQVALGDMISIGAASTGAYIPYDQAMDAALACCGLDADSVTHALHAHRRPDGHGIRAHGRRASLCVQR